MLAPGVKLAHYEILAKIGEGGMGEVFRAADTRLNREVALKVLPQAVASDPQRLSRFQREAQLLASLNHPNIAAIYGLEEAGGVRALVLELVEGPTLADRIAAGPLPAEDAAAIARQIAEGLESAHDRGIIHRDLKPSNVKVTPEGAVKVLDFGLAKAMEDEPAQMDIASSPTLTAAATRAGIILGTAAYMSPEQAKGKRVDRRADIWAFGVVLFEMLAGKPMFSGETASEVMAAVILKDTDWQRLPASTPAPIQALLRRCLDRDPRRRLRDIGEARLILEDYLSNPASAVLASSTSAVSAVPLPLWKRWLPWAGAGLFALAFALSLWQPWRPAPAPPGLARLSIDLGGEPPPQTAFGATVVLSPDGTWMAFTGRPATGRTQIYVRSLDQLEATPLAGTEGARDLFFSPDGQWLAFFADNKLKKVSVSGGGTITLCDAPGDRGGWWGEGDTIVLAAGNREGLSKVSAAGGTPEPLTQLDSQRGEITHRWPQVLPGGKVVLFTAHNAGSGFDQAHIQVQSLVTGEKKTLHPGGSYARFVPDPASGGARGYLIFARQATLFAAPFDLKRLEMIGQPAPLLERVSTTMGTGGAQFAFSNTGAFIYLPGDDSTASVSIFWMDSQARFLPLRAAGANYLNPRFSPDGTRLAVEISEAGGSDIWVYDWKRDTLTRLTFSPSGFRCGAPVWTPDSLRIVYMCDRSGYSIYWKRSDGAGDEQLLLESKLLKFATSWSPDGRTLAFWQEDPKTLYDIWTLPIEGNERSGWTPGKPQPFLVTPFGESAAAFSPDGRWLAYNSNESGRYEIYVRPFPGPGGKWQVSTDSGFYATWSRNGRELFYKSLDEKIMVATYAASGESFRAEKPRLWSDGQFTNRGPSRNFDLHPDGKRMAVLRSPEGTEAAGFSKATLILNVQRALRRLP